MAIDYSIQYPCKVRDAVSEQNLLRMLKSRDRANAVLELAQKSQQPGDVSGEERAVLLMIVGPDGPVEQKVKISDMLAESAPLEELSKNCIDCPGNLRDVPFGCTGTIHYPIAESTERWLVDRLPEKLNEPAGVFLEMAIKDLKITGEGIDASRSRQLIYAAKRPSVRSWGKFIFQKKITSSQILQMLFNVGSLQPTHARMMSLFLGFVDINMVPLNRPQDLLSLEESEGITELKMFLRAAMVSGINGHDLFVDA